MNSPRMLSIGNFSYVLCSKPSDGPAEVDDLMKSNGISGVMIAGIVIFATIGVVVPLFFLYRRHKRVKWDRAVEAVLVRDLELGPKVSNEGVK